jgi:cytochrome c oxidase cbb3-type subunit 3
MRFHLTLFIFFSGIAGAAAYATPDGARLYVQNCAACHGEDGNGGIGVPLALPSFQTVVSDDYLRSTIRHGRPGRVMPAFTALSDDEIAAVVKHVRTWNKGAAATYGSTPIKGDAVHGKTLFANYCSACHGAGGEGGKGTGVTLSRPRDLPIIPPALHNPGFLASITDEMIKTTLVMGRKGTPMLSFRELGLSDSDINDIVSFVRSFEKQPVAKSAEVLDAGAASLIVASPYNLKTTIENLKKAAIANNFVLIREQALNSGLAPQNREDAKQHIVYFCNFDFVNQALATDPRVGLFLPCRITIVEQNGKVMLMSVNPRRLSRIFNNSELNEMCDQMTKRYKAIMEEATL